MILRYGITGFYNAGGEKPPTTDEKPFIQNCFGLINGKYGKIAGCKGQQDTANFFAVEVKTPVKHLHLLLNAHYPFLAFANKAEYGKITFVDDPALGKLFSPFYHVLDTKKLNERIILKPGSKRNILQNANDLNEEELKQIAFWQPETIGEIIYNYWD